MDDGKVGGDFRCDSSCFGVKLPGPNKLGEQGHNLRIELDAGKLFKNCERVIDRHSPAVTTVGRHRIEGIGDGDDSCAKGDALTFQTCRIPAAIPHLMMVKYGKAGAL